MKGIILLAKYYEDMEALITVDMLRRASIEIDLVSLEETLVVKTKSLILTQANYTTDMVNIDDYDFLIIPGGPAVSQTLMDSDVVKTYIEKMMKKEGLVACICAAPALLGKYGYLKNKRFTCFPGFEEFGEDGIYLKNQDAVVDGNVITAKAAGSTFEFVRAIVKYLLNEEAAQQLLDSVYY